MDLALALDYLVPAAEYRGSLTLNTRAAYEKIVWEDKRKQPTYAAVVAADADAKEAHSLAVPAETEIERFASLLERKNLISTAEKTDLKLRG